jgi:FMN phosphatase YigB (HAD superfamily)
LFLIFDLDDTLLDTSATAGRYKLQEVVELWHRLGVLPQPADQALATLFMWRRTAPTARDVLKRYAATYEMPPNALKEAEVEYYDRQHENVPIRAMQGALDCLNSLRKDHRLALVSIGRSDQQRRKMDAVGLDPSQFDHLRIIEEGGKRETFRELATVWGLAPGPGFRQVVVIGDRDETDIAPAQALGMRTVMVGNQPAQQEPDARVQTLDELAPILALWSREKVWGPAIN